MLQSTWVLLLIHLCPFMNTVYPLSDNCFQRDNEFTVLKLSLQSPEIQNAPQRRYRIEFNFIFNSIKKYNYIQMFQCRTSYTGVLNTQPTEDNTFSVHINFLSFVKHSFKKKISFFDQFKNVPVLTVFKSIKTSRTSVGSCRLLAHLIIQR